MPDIPMPDMSMPLNPKAELSRLGPLPFLAKAFLRAAFFCIAFLLALRAVEDFFAIRAPC